MQYWNHQGLTCRYEVYLEDCALGWTPWPYYHLIYMDGIGLSKGELVGGLLAVL